MESDRSLPTRLTMSVLSMQERLRVAVLVIAVAAAGSVSANDLPVDYSRDIQPLLAQYCLACHGSDAEGREAELRLDNAEGAYEWAIVPGKPEESEVLARVLSDDPESFMPPPSTNKSLSDQEKQLLREWIAAGAEYEEHWAFVAPARPAVPPVADQAWPKNEIDRFVLARLEAENLAPAEEADPHTICRRLTLDITGLPPTVDETLAFVDDYNRRGDAALSDLIDRLMDSPRWGEHRARYWLDAARYGDTHGMHFDNYREMWPYRDWVIRAFNENKPYDEFTLEQLAGDLLPNPTEDQLIATGLQRCNMTTNEGGTIAEENLAVYAADRVQTFGWVYLGLTTNCAQCHDHKFDPISIEDYYALAAFFRNTAAPSHDKNTKNGAGPSIVVPSSGDRERWAALPEEIAFVGARREQRRAEAGDDFTAWAEHAKADTVRSLPPAEGLVFHAPLDRNEGSVATGLVAGEVVVSAPAANDVKWPVNDTHGVAPLLGDDATFSFEAVGDFELDQPFSYGLWVRTAYARQRSQLLGKMVESKLRIGWNLVAEDNRYMMHFLDDRSRSGMKVVTSDLLVEPGVWQHVLVSYDGSRDRSGVRIYVDGKPRKKTVRRNRVKRNLASIRNDALLQIGGATKPEPSTETAIQDVRIYDRVLSKSEVNDLYDAQVVARLLESEPADWGTNDRHVAYGHFLRCIDEPSRELAAEHAALARERDAIRRRSPITHVQKERDGPAMANVLMRGAYDAPGDEVAAAPPAALHAMPEGAPPNRLGLAEWVLESSNPLTARVTVNRFWQEVFGRGLVNTPEDFGLVGSPPTHPELLDWLSTDFVDGGWDVKRLFKQMLMSAAYRQSAFTSPEKLRQDRDNALLSRGPRFRMDAEMVRDAALASSGLLSTKMYGPGVKPYQPGGIWDVVGIPGGDTREYRQDEGEDLYRRSVYTFWKRMAPPPTLEVFNAPAREVCTVRRERTNTPLQALAILNDTQFVEAARKLAEKLVPVAESDESRAIDRLSLAVLSRPLTAREADVIRRSRTELLTYYTAQPEAAEKLIGVGDSESDANLDPVALATWTMVCNQVMNLDEAITK